MAYGDTPETETIQIFSACYHYIGTYFHFPILRKTRKTLRHPRDYAAIAKEGILL